MQRKLIAERRLFSVDFTGGYVRKGSSGDGHWVRLLSFRRGNAPLTGDGGAADGRDGGL